MPIIPKMVTSSQVSSPPAYRNQRSTYPPVYQPCPSKEVLQAKTTAQMRGRPLHSVIMRAIGPAGGACVSYAKQQRKVRSSSGAAGTIIYITAEHQYLVQLDPPGVGTTKVAHDDDNWDLVPTPIAAPPQPAPAPPAVLINPGISYAAAAAAAPKPKKEELKFDFMVGGKKSQCLNQLTDQETEGVVCAFYYARGKRWFLGNSSWRLDQIRKTQYSNIPEPISRIIEAGGSPFGRQCAEVDCVIQICSSYPGITKGHFAGSYCLSFRDGEIMDMCPGCADWLPKVGIEYAKD